MDTNTLRQDTIRESTAKLYRWLRSKDFLGHDPHDLLESPLLPKILLSSKALRIAVLQLGRRSPINLHSTLRVPPAFNPKGGALVLSGLLRQPAPDEETIEKLGSRLTGSARKTSHGLGWGYPFAWQSRTHHIPKDLPTIVSTAFVAEALLDLHERRSDDQLLVLLTQAADYILNDIPKHRSDEGIAFGYAERDPQIVFNASLLGAAFLARLGATLGERPYLDAANAAARFVVSHQEPKGSWKYGLESSQKWTDSFHTGYVLMSLRSLARSLQTNQFDASITAGFDYYRRTFIMPSGVVQYFPDNAYPIDTHAQAHAILTLIEFGDREQAERVAEWTIRNMQDEAGYFYYQKHARYMNRIAYMRWSNAWMFRALAELIRE